MKKYILSLFVLAAFASCEETTNSAEKSKTTFLPVVTMNGESEIELECEGTYVEEGVTMTEDGNELEVETVTTGTFFGGHIEGTGADTHWVYDDAPVAGPDEYEISYSAFNKDGIPGAALRHVIVPQCETGDLVTSLSGLYSSSIVRTQTSTGAAAGSYTNVGPIIIKDIGNNTFQLSDMFGGWYVYGRALGYSYGTPGATVKVNNMATNDFDHDVVAPVQTFGGTAVIKDFTVNAATKTIKYTVEWTSNYTFKVTLTQL